MPGAHMPFWHNCPLCLQLSFSVPASMKVPVCKSVYVLCTPLGVHLSLPS